MSRFRLSYFIIRFQGNSLLSTIFYLYYNQLEHKQNLLVRCLLNKCVHKAVLNKCVKPALPALARRDEVLNKGY